MKAAQEIHSCTRPSPGCIHTYARKFPPPPAPPRHWHPIFPHTHTHTTPHRALPAPPGTYHLDVPISLLDPRVKVPHYKWAHVERCQRKHLLQHVRQRDATPAHRLAAHGTPCALDGVAAAVETLPHLRHDPKTPAVDQLELLEVRVVSVHSRPELRQRFR
jgi:hypothetical protein